MSQVVFDQLRAIVAQSAQQIGVQTDTDITLERPARAEHGDVATPYALHVFASQAQKSTPMLWKSPRHLADELAKGIQELVKDVDDPVFATVTVAGPGFINFSLSESVLQASLVSQLQQGSALLISPKNGKTAIVEFSSPNIAKPFTIGHLRSTIIGAAVANLLETTGYQVLRDNHLGDWGTQFGKQIYALLHLGEGSKPENQGKSPEEILQLNLDVINQSEQPVKALVQLYVEYHQAAEADPAMDEAARGWFTKLEQGDKLARQLWQQCVEWSWVEFAHIYDKLGVRFSQEFDNGRGLGEAFFEDKMGVILEELQTKLGKNGSSTYAGSYRESEDAWLVFFPEDELPPLMILKADGSTLYSTRDLATDYYRLNSIEPTPDLIVNEVGAEQSEYFQQLYKVEEMLGWTQPGQRVHVKHGLYRFKDKKMSTRKGDVIWLADVLAEAEKRALALAPESSTAAHVAVASLKWNDLKRSAKLDVTFDWDDILAMQGNSGPYLLYAAVRARHLLLNAAKELQITTESLIDIVITQTTADLTLHTQQEKNLLRLLFQAPEHVRRAATEFAPHIWATYVYEVATAFNTWYAQDKVVEWPTDVAEKSWDSLSDVSKSRLAVAVVVGELLQQGLALLGIETVADM